MLHTIQVDDVIGVPRMRGLTPYARARVCAMRAQTIKGGHKCSSAKLTY